jgi:uncharacterized protein YbcI
VAHQVAAEGAVCGDRTGNPARSRYPGQAARRVLNVLSAFRVALLQRGREGHFMPETQIPRQSVSADISRGAVQLLREWTGRGPVKARTEISKHAVTIMLADTLTKGERSLVGAGRQEHVLHTRHHLQQVMRKDLVRLVETETGRHVQAFMSANHIDPDCAVEFFLLEPPPDVEVSSGRSGQD